MKAYLFPGQGSQFEGMGKDLFEQSATARDLFEQANHVLGYRLTDVMFEGSVEDLKQTRITQPAIFLYGYIKCQLLGRDFRPDALAGHSLGEFTALTAAGSLQFEDGLRLVKARADAMQKACERVQGTMAAVVGLDDAIIEEVCLNIGEVVVAANYNCPGQLVISGSEEGIEAAVKELTHRGARRAIVLSVGGAFHSPLMEPARIDLAAAIDSTATVSPSCPVYQNVSGLPCTDPAEIKQNLIAQLTAPVRWTQTMQHMLADGIDEYVEVGGRVLSGFLKRIDRKIPVSSV